MTRRRLLSATALLGLIAAPLGAAQPETWSVTCQGAKTWANTTAPNTSGGAFQFTLPDGTEIRTTAGMNCFAVRNPPRAS